MGICWEHILRQCLLVKHLKVLLLFHRRGDRLPRGSGRLLTVCLRTDLTFTFHLPSSTSAQGLATWAHLSVFGL